MGFDGFATLLCPPEIYIYGHGHFEKEGFPFCVSWVEWAALAGAAIDISRLRNDEDRTSIFTSAKQG